MEAVQKIKGMKLPIPFPEDKSVKIDFMSSDGDFKLSVKGGSMDECKRTFSELFGAINSTKKKRSSGIGSYR
jgi:hypothetical protein